MKKSYLVFLCSVFCFLFNSYTSVAQIKPAPKSADDELDSLRRVEESKKDTVVYTSKYIRFTTLDLLKDSTRTEVLDTTLTNFQNFNPLYEPHRPTINLGNKGLSYRELLFNPTKSIGFDPGFHALDIYLLPSDSVKYYRARAPFTQLYYVNGGTIDQTFKVIHTQNIRQNWNIGVNYFRSNAPGLYAAQRGDHTNIAIFSWYESKNKRYNLLANRTINTLKAGENGSVIKDTLFTASETLSRDAEIVRLSGTGDNRPVQTWKERGFFLKQSYYIGRIDTLETDTTSSILPTQRVSHALYYNTNRFSFFRNEPDTYNLFPQVTTNNSDSTYDITTVKNLRNEFTYSFYLRGKSVKFIKNELKLDLGLQHDLYWYEQMGFKESFQNITLKAIAGYRLSDRINLTANLQQIAQGRNAGDYLYDAKANVLLSKSVGRIVLGAYLQNRSPEAMFERVNYQFYKWNYSFDRTKINNLSFLYENPDLQFSAKADYFLITNYLYLKEAAIPALVFPEQVGNAINLLKITVAKNFTFGKHFRMDNFIVYQKTDFNSILRTPEVYTYNSFYFVNRFFKVLNANLGFDVRFNTPFAAPSYAVNISQFYNGADVEYSTYPVVDLWLKATLKRANLFLKYDYANQGLFSKGYYTVRRYPMPDAKFRFGVRWNFYD